MQEDFIEAVLEIADLVPAGKVLSYGDVAALLDSGGPRQVGSVMSRSGAAIPWWRIIRASGQSPIGHEARALENYLLEETPLVGDSSAPSGSWRVNMSLARWQPTEEEFDAVDAIAAKLNEAP